LIIMRRRPILLWLAATLIASLGMAGAARAQDEAEPEAEPAVEAQPEFQLQMTDDQFEQWILGKPLETARRLFESWLTKEIERNDRRYWLTPVQKKKLEVAGRGDMKRLFDRIQEAKDRFRSTGGKFNQIGPILQEMQAFQQAPHIYLFGDESMLGKTLKKTLTPGQIASHAKNFYRSRVEWMVSHLDVALGLKPDQHRRFVTLIVEETAPLKQYGSFEYDAMMYQASRLPRDRIRPILDDAQLTKLLVRFEQADRMKTILFNEGYLPSAVPGAGRPSELDGGPKPKAFEDQTRRRLLIGAGQTGRD
jgi:hypothetical protein